MVQAPQSDGIIVLGVGLAVFVSYTSCESLFENFGKACWLGHSNSTSTLPIETCPEGYSCRRCITKTCREGEGQCFNCPYLGEYCPEGTINENSHVGATHCATGKICENTTVQLPCRAGWFCPGAVFGYVDALQCRQGFGTYCPEGSSTNLSGCPGGFYCPTPAQKLVCPANHFCREFSTAPRKCPLSSRCPEGASLPKTSFVGLAVAVVAMVTVGAVTQGVMWRHAVKAHRHRHKLQRAVQTSDNCSTFVMDMLGDAGNALLGEAIIGMRIEGFAAKAHPVTVTFKNLRLELASGVVPLASVSGVFLQSKVTTIMGNSGSGKSTLLKTMFGFNHAGRTSGEVYLNRERGSLRRIKRQLGFVQQEDMLFTFSSLTVREVLKFSAHLRLPADLSPAQRDSIVNGTLQLLLLTESQNLAIGEVGRSVLSGGQRRRVNIGVELAADPTVVFLDEPTSGLSATDALVIMKSLWSLSCLQCTVVAVIHSPRAVVFKMFSHVLLLGRGGHAVFFGPAKKVMWYFQQIGFKIAPGVNPADYCLDVLSGHARPVTNTLELGPRYDAMTFLKYHWNDHSESSPFRAISDHTDHQVAQVFQSAEVVQQNLDEARMPREPDSPRRADDKLDGCRSTTEPMDEVSQPPNQRAPPQHTPGSIGAGAEALVEPSPPLRGRRWSGGNGAGSGEKSGVGLGTLQQKMLATGEGKLTRTTSLDNNVMLNMVESLRARWEAVAGAGSGGLSSEEVREVFRQNGVSISEQELRDFMAELDANEDGTVDLEEFLDYVNRLRILHDGMVYKLVSEEATGRVVAVKTSQAGHGKIEEDSKRARPTWLNQLRTLTRRSLYQYCRKLETHMVNGFILVFGGLVIGQLRSFTQSISDIPSSMCLVSTVMGVLSSTSALSYFGAEKRMHLHERRMGVNMLSYFLGKCICIQIDVFMHPLLFLCTYYNFVYTNIDFATFWILLILTSWVSSGIGMILSEALSPEPALLGATVVPLILGVFLGGIDPRLADLDAEMRGVCALSPVRWSTEALTIAELRLEMDASDVRVQSIYDAFGYDRKMYPAAISVLIFMGFFLRWVSFMILSVGDWVDAFYASKLHRAMIDLVLGAPPPEFAFEPLFSLKRGNLEEEELAFSKNNTPDPIPRASVVPGDSAATLQPKSSPLTSAPSGAVPGLGLDVPASLHVQSELRSVADDAKEMADAEAPTRNTTWQQDYANVDQRHDVAQSRPIATAGSSLSPVMGRGAAELAYSTALELDVAHASSLVASSYDPWDLGRGEPTGVVRDGPLPHHDQYGNHHSSSNGGKLALAKKRAAAARSRQAAQSNAQSTTSHTTTFTSSSHAHVYNSASMMTYNSVFESSTSEQEKLPSFAE